MDFLKRNSGKIALLAIVAFFTLPFIYGNEEEEDFSPFAVKSGMSYQANPISKLANKIASFYGFSKPASQMMASSGSVDSIKDKVSFNKEHSFNRGGSANSQNDTLVASSRNFKNFDTNSSNSNFSNTRNNNSKNNFAHNSYNNNDPIKGYVTINGQNYPVIEDALGDKYVVTPKGHVPYKELLRRTVSDKEIMDAKKRFPGASDMEILAALQQEKERQALANRQRYQANATGYKNGTATNMGGTNYARVSTEDTGFDEDVLNEAYADLKNINLKNGRDALAPSGSGTSRSSFSGSSARGNNYSSAQAGSYDQSGEQSGNSLISSGITKSVQEQVNLQSSNRGNYQRGNEGARPTKPGDAFKPTVRTPKPEDKPQNQFQNNQEEVYESQDSVVIRDLTYEWSTKAYKYSNDGTTGDVLFIEEDNYNNYSEWGTPTQVTIGNKQISGILIPQIDTQTNKLIEPEEDGLLGNNKQISENISKINSDIDKIKQLVNHSLPSNVKLYVDTGKMDSRLSGLIQNIMKKKDSNGEEINFVTTDRNAADIILPELILTPSSFNQFYNDFSRQLQNIENSQAGNIPA